MRGYKNISVSKNNDISYNNREAESGSSKNNLVSDKNKRSYDDLSVLTDFPTEEIFEWYTREKTKNLINNYLIWDKKGDFED